jgi:hypothetical protein
MKIIYRYNDNINQEKLLLYIFYLRLDKLIPFLLLLLRELFNYLVFKIYDLAKN